MLYPIVSGLLMLGICIFLFIWIVKDDCDDCSPCFAKPSSPPKPKGSKSLIKKKEVLKTTTNKLQEAKEELEVTTRLKTVIEESSKVQEALTNAEKELNITKTKTNPIVKIWTDDMDKIEADLKEINK